MNEGSYIGQLQGLQEKNVTISTHDIDAKRFFWKAGIKDAREKRAVNRFVKDCKSSGIWTKLIGCYPFSPTSLEAASFNLKNPEIFQLDFINTPTHSKFGVDWNGTDQYAKTGIIPTTHLLLNDVHLAYYSQEDINENKVELGIIIDGDERLVLIIRWNSTNTSRFMCYAQTGEVVGSTNNSDIFSVGSRISSTDLRMFKNGFQIGSTIITSSGVVPSIELYIGANNLNSNPGFFSSKQCAFASIGKGLTVAEVAIFSDMVNEYQTNVITDGRNVY